MQNNYVKRVIPIKTRIIFVRHAEAEGNLNRVFHGWTDSSITEKGHLQAQRTAERLKKVDIDVIYSSSMKRTLQTAQYIADVKNLPIIRTDKLKEINGGEWEDRKWEELPQLWPDEYDSWENRPHEHKMPSGETMVEFQKRLIDEVKYIINNNKGKNICIVTHGTAIRSMMCYFKRCALTEMINIEWYDNTSVTVLDYEDGEFDIVLEGDTSHLEKELCTVQNQKWWKEYNEKFEQRNQKDK